MIDLILTGVPTHVNVLLHVVLFGLNLLALFGIYLLVAWWAVSIHDMYLAWKQRLRPAARRPARPLPQ